MTNRATILHGTDATPESNWFPWLKIELESRGYEVWVPELPNNHMPDRNVYNDYLFGQGWDFTDNLVIGHSSGAVSVLNLLSDKRCPHIKLGIVVSAWSHGIPDEMDYEQFVELFPPNGFDFEKIKSNTDKLVFIHGEKDPYCPLEQAQWLAKNTNAKIIVVKDGDHLGEKYKELPEILEYIDD